MNIKLILPLPISINQAYAGYRIRHKSDKYKQRIDEARIAYFNQTKFYIEGDSWLEVNYKYYMPIYCKNGSKKKIDVFNLEKVLSDFLEKSIVGFEDHKIKKGYIEKIESNKNIVEIEIKELI